MAGAGSTLLRQSSVGTIWLTNLEHCVAPQLARELVTRLSRANRTLGSSYLAADICSIRRLTDADASSSRGTLSCSKTMTSSNGRSSSQRSTASRLSRRSPSAFSR
jgi:hypothetical protein